MITLRTFIEQEQPSINAALAEAAAELPASIMPIAQYAMGNGGKRLRPLLTVLVARLLGYADNDIYSLAAAMEMFHVATLLHDDVMDNAEMRRGSTATHKVFGVTETILAGDALLAKGNQIVAGFGDPRLTAATSDAIAQTANGEILEIAGEEGSQSAGLQSDHCRQDGVDDPNRLQHRRDQGQRHPGTDCRGDRLWV